MMTGVASVKLAIAGFIVPFMFVYSPQLMLINTTLAEGLLTAGTACVGVFLIGTAVEGYVYTFMPVWLRVIAAVGALLLMKPGFETDIIGVAVLVLVLFLQKKRQKSEQKTAGV